MYFQNNGGNSFFLEAGRFDTVPEIKHLIKHDKEIPIFKLFDDEFGSDHSKIELFIDDSNHVKEPSKIPLLLRMPSLNLIATEIDVNDTIIKLKEEIHEIEDVPVEKLILRVNGLELNDQKSIKECHLPHNSEVIASVAAIPVKSPPLLSVVAAGNHIINSAEEFVQPQRIQLLLYMPLPKIVPIEISVNDTVKKLKEKLYEMEGVHPIRLILHANGIALNDLQPIKDYELSDKSRVMVSIQAVPITAAPQPSAGLMVVFEYDGKRIAVEVNSLDTVGELKNKLQSTELNLPQDCFFIHNQAVMSDDRSLRWHRVTHGDTIDIFMGYVA